MYSKEIALLLRWLVTRAGRYRKKQVSAGPAIAVVITEDGVSLQGTGISKCAAVPVISKKGFLQRSSEGEPGDINCYAVKGA